MKTKEGSVRDVALMVVVVFALAVAYLIIHYISGSVVTELVNNAQINDSSTGVEAFNTVNTITSRLDYVLFCVFLAFGLGIIITGFFVPAHPLFVFLYFIVVCGLTGVSAIVSNFWETLTQTAPLSSSLSAFPLTNHILTFFPLYVAVVGTVGLIVMFAKPSGGTR